MKTGTTSKPQEPLVSVIIPTFNRSSYIRQALDSVLRQIYPQPEVIVVDDGSTDDTCQVLAPYRDRIHYLHQEKQGQSAARNLGLQSARGKFIAFLDSDDYLLPNTLADQLACFSADPSLGAVQGGWRLVDQDGKFLGSPKPWQHAPDLDLETWALANPLFLGAALFRREWTERTGRFDTELVLAEDLDYILRMALLGCKMRWLRRPVVCYRQHDGNITRSVRVELQFIEYVLTNFFQHPDLPEQIRNKERHARYYRHAWFAWRLFHAGETDAVYTQLKRSLACSRISPEETLHDWLRLFINWQYHRGYELDQIKETIPLMLASNRVELKLWRHTDKNKWWGRVWWLYVGNQFDHARRTLAAGNTCGFLELMSLAKTSLLSTPHEVAVRVIDRFWRDALALQRVPRSHQNAVTGLYLTAFGQAALANRKRAALDALRSALRHTRDVYALSAWSNFIYVSVRYLVGVIR